MSDDAAIVRHNEAEHRYEIAVDGKVAIADYVFEGGKQVFTHTFVPPEFRGRGYAEALVRTALTDAKAAGRKVVPACSYVDVFIQRNKEFASLLSGNPRAVRPDVQPGERFGFSEEEMR